MLRTNLEVLERSDTVRGRLRSTGSSPTSCGQLEELTVLVEDLVELAREDDGPEPFAEDVRLDEIVDGVDRARARRHPKRTSSTSTAAGDRARRAVEARPRDRKPRRQRGRSGRLRASRSTSR